MAHYLLTFWSERKWFYMTMQRKLFVMHRRRFLWQRNRWIKRGWRALQQRREDARYTQRGEPAPRARAG